MKLKAILTVDIDAADIYDAQARREQLAELVRRLKGEYADARLEVRARRTRAAPRAAVPPKLGAEYEVVRVRRLV